MKSKSFVFADSVVCLGGISTAPVQAWKDKIIWYLEPRYPKDLDRIDGEHMEFEWRIFPGFTTLGILAEIQKMMAESKCEPEQFEGRIIFMSMLCGEHREIMKIVWRIPGMLQHVPTSSRMDVGHFWDLVVRNSGMELLSVSHMVNGTKLQKS